MARDGLDPTPATQGAAPLGCFPLSQGHAQILAVRIVERGMRRIRGGGGHEIGDVIDALRPGTRRRPRSGRGRRAACRKRARRPRPRGTRSARGSRGSPAPSCPSRAGRPASVATSGPPLLPSARRAGGAAWRRSGRGPPPRRDLRPPARPPSPARPETRSTRPSSPRRIAPAGRVPCASRPRASCHPPERACSTAISAPSEAASESAVRSTTASPPTKTTMCRRSAP